MGRSLKSAFAALFLISSGAVAVAGSGDVADLFRKGSRAYEQGDLDTAEATFRQILKGLPGHVPSRDMLARIETTRARAKDGALERNLAKLVIPAVNFQEVSLPEALDFMRIRLRELGSPANIILIDPARKLEDAQIADLRLRNVPATEVLKFIAEMTGASILYKDKNVILRPREAG